MTERYIADVTLGRLGRWLRLLGLDVEYIDSHDLSSVVKKAMTTSRKIITRRRGPISHAHVLIKSNSIEEQLVEFFVSEKLEADREKFFSRCSVCNNLLAGVGKDIAQASGVPEYVLLSTEKFLSCEGCHRMYWSGSHKEKFLGRIKTLNIPFRKSEKT